MIEGDIRTNLDSAKEKFLCDSSLKAYLSSLKWSNLVVSNLRLHPDLESQDLTTQFQAAEHFQVRSESELLCI